MKRTALILACVSALALSVAIHAPASAESTRQVAGTNPHWVDFDEDEGDWVEGWSWDDGTYYFIKVFKNYELVEILTDQDDNPNPLEGGKESLTKEQWKDLLKRFGGRLTAEDPFSRSPLGKLLTSRGRTLDTRHNPAETGLTEDWGGGGGGFNPGNGSPAEQVKNRAKKGNKNGAEGDDGDDLKPGDVGLFDDTMPGPPELINPNPVGFERADHGRDGRSDGGGAGNAGGAGGGPGGGGAAGGGSSR